MLRVAEARAVVLSHARPGGTEDVALAEALDRVLAEAVVTPHALPPFDNAAMDGFACPPGPAGQRLRIAGESRAGHPYAVAVAAGEAVRISTGAMLPAGADSVVMVEHTTEHDDGTVTLGDEATPGRNVRRAGEDVPAGTTVLQPPVLLGPAELGVASSAGTPRLRCARRPRVVVLATGDELVPPGTPLGPGQIHDSNVLTLAALATRDGAQVVATRRVADDAEATHAAIAAALDEADLLLLSGGVSVGPHDHVKPALEAAGVEEAFWRVALRPGKPTWCGMRGTTLVLGLPGNPVSAMVTYLLFARPALKAMLGLDPAAPHRPATLMTAVQRTPHRDEMVRVELDGDRATPTGAQGSHRLTSMLGAEGLALVPAGEGELPAGTQVEVELL